MPAGHLMASSLFQGLDS